MYRDERRATHLDVVPAMVVAALAEESVRDRLRARVEAVEHGVCVLHARIAHIDKHKWDAYTPRAKRERKREARCLRRTLLRLAVKTTTSYSSPMRRRKASTPGRLST